MFRIYWRTERNSGVMTFSTFGAFMKMIPTFRAAVQWHALARDERGSLFT